MKACLLIPIYQHRRTIRGVVEALEKYGLPCIIVDDGSDLETRAVLEEVAGSHAWVHVHHCPANRGKGAALRTGYRLAFERGFSHAIQLDADAQHDPADVPRFLEASRQNSGALVLGDPRFDESAPRLRIWSRQLSRGLVWLATLSFSIRDPLCGYRSIPLEPTLRLLDRVPTGDHMEFEPELAVRLLWSGVPVVNVATPIVYRVGGESHFDLLRDYPRLAWLYLRLVAGMLPRARHLLGRPTERDERTPSRAAGWAALSELGSLGALRFGGFVHRLLGRRLTRMILMPIAAYFYLTAPRVRGASLSYLQAVWEQPGGPGALGHEPRSRDALRHMHQFAINLMDRATAWGGGLEGITFEHSGSEHLFRLARQGRGGILLGSHLGSFDMMRLLATEHGLVLNVLMFTDRSEQINSFLGKLDPKGRVRVIRMDSSSMRTAFEVRACLERGEFIGILGDRLSPSATERALPISFLGRPAPFSLRPFLLALVTGSPILFALCVRRGDATYRARVEPLWEGGVVTRAERDARARQLLETYVARLEASCLETPLQWFNFYDFWATEPKNQH